MAVSKVSKIKLRKRRHARVRAKVFGTAIRPRLSVFKSNKHVYAQLIDDNLGRTIASASDFELGQKKPKKKDSQLKKTEIAVQVGNLLAKKAKDLKIEQLVFDRGGFKYHGRIKALAEAVRSHDLKL